MKLVGFFASPYVARVELFARIKGLDLASEPPPGDGLKSVESLAFNPIARMPSLEVDGRCVAESTIICDFLEDAFPEKPGLPSDPYDRAMSRLIDRITDLYIASQGLPLFSQMNPETRDEAAVEAAREALTNAYGYLEHFMGAGPFAVGDTPTLGDCALAPYMGVLKQAIYPNFSSLEDPTSSPGRLQDWWQAVSDDAVLGPGMLEYERAFGEFLKGFAKR